MARLILRVIKYILIAALISLPGIVVWNEPRPAKQLPIIIYLEELWCYTCVLNLWVIYRLVQMVYAIIRDPRGARFYEVYRYFVQQGHGIEMRDLDAGDQWPELAAFYLEVLSDTERRILRALGLV
jgi:hypothetical protein